MLMDSTFLLTVVAAAIGFMVYRNLRFPREETDLDSSLPPSSSSSCPSPLSSSSPSSFSSSSSSSPPSPPSSSSSLSVPSPPSYSYFLCSSSIPSSCEWTHDVFPSFRGEDVRKNFLSHFKKELQRKGITPFIDNEIKRGESIGPELIRAIQRSKIAIVLFSKNYATSKWCLDELVEVMKCKKELDQTVFPIFYGVSPSDVRKLTGDFGAVFENTCAGKTKEDTERWRQAFEEMAKIAGYDLSNWDDEAAMIEEIVTQISKTLISSTPSRFTKGLIGMGAHMEKMKPLVFLGSDEVRMVGIWGPSGIGKTTIARVLYHQISDYFQLSVFMTFKPSYARPTCSDDHDEKLHFEQQFLSKLLNQEDFKISHLGAAQNFVLNKKVLVIFDGVDQLVQLHAMPEAQYFGPGTRIIITTQDVKILNAYAINHIYSVDFPPPEEALQIFCISAFGQHTPKDGFQKLAEKVTILAGQLPLGLKIMGSHFKGIQSKKEWKAELLRLRARLDGNIESILKFSYDALQEEDKDLFLHIACFFNDEGIDDISEHALGHSFSSVSQGLRVLAQRSLISDKQIFPMHNLLVQLGRNIVRNQSMYEPGKRRFLVDAKNICEVLAYDTDSSNVIGINFDTWEMEDDLYISDRAFEKVANLEFLRCHIGYSRKKLHFPQGLNYLPPKLRVLHWNDFPMRCLPCMFNPKLLVKINMECSNLEKLWDGIQPLPNLKLINLSSSNKLKEVPDLSTATNLVKLKLSYCKSLMKLTSSIGNATNLQELDLGGCSSLVELPLSIGNVKCLKKLNLVSCSSLLELPSCTGNLSSLQELDFAGCSNLVKLPSSIGNFKRLRKLWINSYSGANADHASILDQRSLQESDLDEYKRPEMVTLYLRNAIYIKELFHVDCSYLRKHYSSVVGNAPKTDLQDLYRVQCPNLVEIPSSIGNMTNLQELLISRLSSLKEIPSSIGNLTNLQELCISSLSSLVEIPSSIGNLISLHTLSVEYCPSLVELPCSIGNLVNLQYLTLTRCPRLPDLPSLIGNLNSLKNLYIMELFSLVELPNSIGNLTNLQILFLCGCLSLVELPSSLGNLTNLQKLDLRHCSSLIELPSSIGNITNLEELDLGGCTSLRKLPFSIGNLINIPRLNLGHCSSLVELPCSIGNLINLTSLDLTGCSNIVELPSSIGNLCVLSKLILKECSKLEVLPVDINLDSLADLDFTGCSQLRSFPEISTTIERLMLCRTLIKEVPLSIKLWSRLQDLHIPYFEDLEECPHALDLIIELESNNTEIEEFPPWFNRFSRLRRLKLNRCRKLVSLPQLPSSLLSVVAENCESLERLACSFPQPNFCLKFINCWKLNEETRDIIIETSTLGYCILPGREVHKFFTNRATGGGPLTVNLTERRFPTSLKFGACILLVNKGDKVSGAEKQVIIKSTITDRENRRVTTLPFLRNERCLHPLLADHMYTFEMEAINVESSELCFEFSLFKSKEWKIAACGIRQLSEENPDVEGFITA